MIDTSKQIMLDGLTGVTDVNQQILAMIMAKDFIPVTWEQPQKFWTRSYGKEYRLRTILNTQWCELVYTYTL